MKVMILTSAVSLISWKHLVLRLWSCSVINTYNKELCERQFAGLETIISWRVNLTIYSSSCSGNDVGVNGSGRELGIGCKYIDPSHCKISDLILTLLPITDHNSSLPVNWKFVLGRMNSVIRDVMSTHSWDNFGKLETSGAEPVSSFLDRSLQQDSG